MAPRQRPKQPGTAALTRGHAQGPRSHGEGHSKGKLHPPSGTQEQSRRTAERYKPYGSTNKVLGCVKAAGALWGHTHARTHTCVRAYVHKQNSEEEQGSREHSIRVRALGWHEGAREPVKRALLCPPPAAQSTDQTRSSTRAAVGRVPQGPPDQLGHDGPGTRSAPTAAASPSAVSPGAEPPAPAPGHRQRRPHSPPPRHHPDTAETAHCQPRHLPSA